MQGMGQLLALLRAGQAENSGTSDYDVGDDSSDGAGNLGSLSGLLSGKKNKQMNYSQSTGSPGFQLENKAATAMLSGLSQSDPLSAMLLGAGNFDVYRDIAKPSPQGTPDGSPGNTLQKRRIDMLTQRETMKNRLIEAALGRFGAGYSKSGRQRGFF